jgi:hypothetical protein
MSEQKKTPRKQSEAPDIEKIYKLMDEAEKLLRKSKRDIKNAKKLLEPYLPKDD